MEDRQAHTIEDFTRLMVQSQLVEENRVKELVEGYRHEYLPTSKLPDGITGFCNFVVEAGDLTTWQCQKLRSGKWKGFFDLKGFVILDGLETDEHSSYVLARSLKDGAIVRIQAMPGGWTKERGIQFRVDHRYE